MFHAMESNGATLYVALLTILVIIQEKLVHFFLPPLSPSSLRSQEMTFPSMTTPLPSMNATRDNPSQFLKVSHTRGCCGAKLHWAISLDFKEWGSSIFLPPVSLPIFHL